MSLLAAASEEVRKQLASALSLHGFDICHPFHTTWYNRQLDREGLALRRLPVGDAFLIGNTKRLWPLFITWLQQHDGTSFPPNPLDTFVSTQLTRIIREQMGNDASLAVFWDHTWDKAELVSMSRVASVSGLCYLHPTALLCIHPKYGAWLSLRAVVVYESNAQTSSPPPPPPPPLLSNPLSLEQDETVKTVARQAFDHHTAVFDQKEMARGAKVAAQPWIDLRDSVPIGREYRFTDNQLRYHYLKDTRLLTEEVTKTVQR